MKKTDIFPKFSFIILLSAFFLFISSGSSYAYWLWTSESGKWTNPKHDPKDSPDTQFDWAMNFYNSGDYEKAENEFKKLIKFYPLSRLAAESQFYLGDIAEQRGDYIDAYKAYQKVVDRYPYSERIGEIIEREYRIGNLFYTGQKRKILGMELLPSIDQASEIFERVVKNAPYGRYAPLAQYKLGLCHKQQGEFELARIAFEKVVDEYPDSDIADDAKYQVALCTMSSSFESSYDQEKTGEAIEEFESVLGMKPSEEVKEETKNAIKQLREKKAKQAYDTAEFYVTRKKFASAMIYYQEVVDDYSDTSFATLALEKMVQLKKEKHTENK